MFGQRLYETGKLQSNSSLDKSSHLPAMSGLQITGVVVCSDLSVFRDIKPNFCCTTERWEFWLLGIWLLFFQGIFCELGIIIAWKAQTCTGISTWRFSKGKRLKMRHAHRHKKFACRVFIPACSPHAGCKLCCRSHMFFRDLVTLAQVDLFFQGYKMQLIIGSFHRCKQEQNLSTWLQSSFTYSFVVQIQCNYVVRYWNVGWALPTAVLFVWNQKQSEGKQAIWPQTIESNRQLQGQKLWLLAVDLGERGIRYSIYETQALK